MAIKLYNKKNGLTANCEVLNWVEKCDIHAPKKGWVLWTSEMENTPARKAYLSNLDEVLDNGSGNITVEDYALIDTDEDIEEIVFEGTLEGLEDASERLIEDIPQDFSDYNTRAAALRAKNFEDIRTQGIGSNFSVIEPHDGYEKNGRLWFGKCNECGETVTNSSLKGLWEHKIVTSKTANSESWSSSNSCPTADEGLGTTAEARLNKRKPRMTKAERAFYDEVSAVIFATPEVRDGKNYMDREAFHKLPQATQDRWMALTAGKTF